MNSNWFQNQSYQYNILISRPNQTAFEKIDCNQYSMLRDTVQWCLMDINVLQNLTGKPEFRSESAPAHADWVDLSGLIICLSKHEQTSNIVRGPAEIWTRASCSWCHPILPPSSMCTMWPPAWVTWSATRLTESMMDNIYRSAYVGWTTSHNDLGKKQPSPNQTSLNQTSLGMVFNQHIHILGIQWGIHHWLPRFKASLGRCHSHCIRWLTASWKRNMWMQIHRRMEALSPGAAPQWMNRL